MDWIRTDAVFVAKALAWCALAGIGLVVVFGPLVMFLHVHG